MRLWTFQAGSVQVNTPGLRIDPTLGEYWNNPNENVRQNYRAVLPKLHRHLGTDQFLWCWTVRDQYISDPSDGKIGWALNIPRLEIIIFYRMDIWESIFWKGAAAEERDWKALFVDLPPEQLTTSEFGALVLLPIEPEWAKRIIVDRRSDEERLEEMRRQRRGREALFNQNDG